MDLRIATMRGLLLSVAMLTAIVNSVAQVAPIATAQAPSEAASASVVPTVAAGRQAYTRTCARCHGINLAVTSSAYYDLRTFPKEEKERFIASVTQGKRQMPAWGGIVKPDDIEAIWLYVGSVNNW